MNSRKTELSILYLIVDLFILYVSFYLVFKSGLIENQHNDFNIGDSIQESLAWVITYFIISKKNLYLRDGFSNRAWRITIRTMVYAVISVLIAVLIFNNPILPRNEFLFSLLIFYLLRLVFYFFVYRVVNDLRTKGRFIKRAVIIGSDSTAKSLASILDNNKILGFKFLGFVSPNETIKKKELCKLSEFEGLIETMDIQEFFVTFNIFEDQSHLKSLLKLSVSKGIRIKLVPKREAFINFKNQSSVGGIMVIDPFEFPLDNFWSRFQKRTFDVVFSLIVCTLLLSWLIPIMAIIIKLSSKGPVFFTQQRTGIGNKTFKVIKFRTMKQSDDANTKQASAKDNRITKIGVILRKYNIDELPQFICVLTGSMAVVGPRPHMLAHTDLYSKSIINYKSRHYIKPGITGWAQINGFRGETDKLWKMEKRVEFDLEYIEDWSLIKDCKIILATLFDKKSYLNAH